jgi:hypothetical protein
MRPHHVITALVAASLSACSTDAPLMPESAGPQLAITAAAALDISGVWSYEEETFLVLNPQGTVIHLRCASPDGVLTIEQTGATFTGTLTHPTGSCVTKDGVVIPPPWPLPYEATLSGRVTGRALHIEQFDAPPAPPVRCPKDGNIVVGGGQVIGFTTTGRCDLSGAPFRPAVATNSGTAQRE